MIPKGIPLPGTGWVPGGGVCISTHSARQEVMPCLEMLFDSVQPTT